MIVIVFPQYGQVIVFDLGVKSSDTSTFKM
nr:MAG TPA: hypothetical protein [Caudoviricetes sp.]